MTQARADLPDRFARPSASEAPCVWPLLIVPPPVMRMTPIVNHVERSPRTERIVAPVIEVVPDAPVAVTFATRSEPLRAATVMSVSAFGARAAEERACAEPRPDTVASRSWRAVDLGVHRPPDVVRRDVVERVVDARRGTGSGGRPTRPAAPPSGRPRSSGRTSSRPRRPKRGPCRPWRRPRRWRPQPRRSGRRRPGRACRGT